MTTVVTISDWFLYDIGSPPKRHQFVPNSNFSLGNFLCLGSLGNLDSLDLSPGWRYKIFFKRWIDGLTQPYKQAFENFFV